MFRDTPRLLVLSNHEAGNVLQEEKRNVALIAQLNEMRTLERRLGEQHALVRHNAHRVTVDMAEASYEGLAVFRLEFGEVTAVQQPCEGLANVVGHPMTRWNDAIQLRRIGSGIFNG